MTRHDDDHEPGRAFDLRTMRARRKALLALGATAPPAPSALRLRLDHRDTV